MAADPLYQLRIYLEEDMAGLARADRAAPSLRPLMAVLERHRAAPVSQLDAFTAYVEAAEREGVEGFPLYRWTRATLEDPEKRRKHLQAFALRIGGEEVYPKAAADALEAELQPLVGAGLVTRLSRHDTDPAKNLAVPAEYRS